MRRISIEEVSGRVAALQQQGWKITMSASSGKWRVMSGGRALSPEGASAGQLSHWLDALTQGAALAPQGDRRTSSNPYRMEVTFGVQEHLAMDRVIAETGENFEELVRRLVKEAGSVVPPQPPVLDGAPTLVSRTAIVLDEEGKEIFRGHPADMPFRFIEGDDMTEVTLNSILESGIPIDSESGADLELNDAG